MILVSMQTAVILAALLTAAIVPQVVLTAWFISATRTRTRAFARRADGRGHAAGVPAEVILCLKGCDPTLDAVFDSLARQRHRDWRLRVIVDAVSDPAWVPAEAAIRRLAAAGVASWRDAVIEPLEARPATGSLKCASLRQAFATLDPRTRVVALVDADSVVHDEWLVSMVDECLLPGVGAVSGNRWYDPVRDSLPGTVRALWNAGAIVQMTAFGIPWGGSLAVRREALDACGWADVIRTTLCEDTALASPLARAGWAYRFVPALVAIDEDDDVATGPLTRWIARQLLTARLHHPRWPLVAVHGLGTSVTLAVTAAFCIAAAWSGAWAALAVAAGAIVAYELISVGLMVGIEATVREAVAAVGNGFRPTSLARTVWRCAMVPVTQGIYAAATCAAMLTRSIEWRGVVYEIHRPAGRAEVRVRTSG